jgi:hypothetical protein
MACRNGGIESSIKKVPDKNIIGKAIAFPSAEEASFLTSPPRIIPRPENATIPVIIMAKVSRSKAAAAPKIK